MNEPAPTPSEVEAQIESILSGIDDPVGALTSERNEVPETEEEPKEEPKAEESEEEEAPEDEAELDETEEEADDAESEETEEELDVTELKSISDLAEALELDDQALSTLTARIKVDGKESDVPLADLTRSYQEASHNNVVSRELADQRKQFQEQAQHQTQALEAQLHGVGTMLNALEQQVVGAINSDELARLKEQDQTTWLAKRTELQDAYQNFNLLKQQAADSYAQVQTQSQNQFKSMQQEMIKESQEKLPVIIPNWNDDLYQTVMKYGVDQGLQAEEVQNLVNWRHIDILNKARLYDESQKQAKETVKRVKKAPKVMKKTAKKDPVKVPNQRIKEAQRRFTKSKSKEDAVSLMEQILS